MLLLRRRQLRRIGHRCPRPTVLMRTVRGRGNRACNPRLLLVVEVIKARHRLLYGHRLLEDRRRVCAASCRMGQASHISPMTPSTMGARRGMVQRPPSVLPMSRHRSLRTHLPVLDRYIPLTALVNGRIHRHEHLSRITIVDYHSEHLPYLRRALRHLVRFPQLLLRDAGICLSRT